MTPAAAKDGYAAGLWLTAWRLLPANPILVRVVCGASRRVRHLWIRFGYLAFLMGVVLISMITASGGGSGSTLADLAKNASTVFMGASVTQLALMCFLAPVFTAGAITQERDAQTFNILLATPLSNAQIVLGSLMSRLYFVLVLLLGGLPVFLITMIYGGVTLGQIVQSFAIAGSTAVLTGSLAICISMIRVGTRRTIFSFYLMIGLYLLAVYALGKWPGTWIEEAHANTAGQRVSWAAAIHPFLALDVAMNVTPAPDAAVLGGHPPVVRYILAYPHRAYVLITLTCAGLLTLAAMIFVRRTKEGDITFFSAIAARLRGREAGERRRKPRHVWKNPVAWREATTRASAATKGFSQFVLLGGGITTGGVLLWWHIDSGDVAWTRQALAVVLMVELGLTLLVAANTAATSMTKEKESNTMDLLLATPLTSRYLVAGKLRGLVTFTLPLIAVPVLTLLAFGVHGLIAQGERVIPIEAAFEAAALLVVYSAAACLTGSYYSLHRRRTVQAVMLSVGTVVVGCLVLTLVGDSIVRSSKLIGAFLAPMTPFTGIRTLADPARLFDSPAELTAKLPSLRVYTAVGCAAAVLIYVLIEMAVYRSMVRNFDMIVRKQSGR